MRKFPFDTDILAIEVDKVYFYHDVPRLFTAKDAAGKCWLVLWADEHELDDKGRKIENESEESSGGQDDWLAVPITDERLAKVEAGEIDLRDAFRHAEGGRGVYAECPWPKGVDTAKWVILADLDPNLFHMPGVKLG